MAEALKDDQERMLRTSHQKCLVEASRMGNEMWRTREAAGLVEVRKLRRLVLGVGSGVAARLKGDWAREL
jgi:hypothetical protein